MIRWIILIVAVIALTGVVAFMSQDVTNSEAGPTPAPVNEKLGPQPKIEINTPQVHEFGSMSQFRKDSHTWEVKNVGEAELQLWLDHSTCSCTIAKLAAQDTASKDGTSKEKKIVRVKPNESIPITLDFETKNFQNTYEKGAWIGSNDPAKPLFSLFVKGMVYPPVMVFPPELIKLDGISNEETAHATIAVYSKDMPTMKITKLSTGRPAIFTAKQQPLTKLDRQQLQLTAGGYRIDLEVKPGLPLGRFSDELVVETNHPLQKETKISIHGFTTGPISIIPEGVRMTGVSSKVGATHSLTLLVRGGRPTKFEVIEKPKILNVTIAKDPAQEGKYRLTVAIPAGTPPTSIDSEMIVVKTDHPRATELKIPVKAVVTNSSAN